MVNFFVAFFHFLTVLENLRQNFWPLWNFSWNLGQPKVTWNSWPARATEPSRSWNSTRTNSAALCPLPRRYATVTLIHGLTVSWFLLQYTYLKELNGCNISFGPSTTNGHSEVVDDPRLFKLQNETKTNRKFDQQQRTPALDGKENGVGGEKIENLSVNRFPRRFFYRYFLRNEKFPFFPNRFRHKNKSKFARKMAGEKSNRFFSVPASLPKIQR